MTYSVCQTFRDAEQKEPLKSQPAPIHCLEKVGVDLFTFRGIDYLIPVSYLSGCFEVDRLPSKRAADIIYGLKMYFA